MGSGEVITLSHSLEGRIMQVIGNRRERAAKKEKMKKQIPQQFTVSEGKLQPCTLFLVLSHHCGNMLLLRGQSMPTCSTFLPQILLEPAAWTAN